MICLLLTAVLLALPSCLKIDEEEAVETAAVGVIHYYPSATYSYSTKVDESILKTGLHSDYLLLVNKKLPLGEAYVPPSLVTLRTDITYGEKSIELNSRAADALYLMMQEMNAAGVTDVKVTSAYRSYQYQTSLFNQYLNDEAQGISKNAYACFGEDYIQKNYVSRGLKVLSTADAKAVVLSYSAAPGSSEHQSGLCVDFMTSTMTDLDLTFETTQAFAWLSQNAYRFGYILRYPKGKEGITGYTYEPWHYRFVGREAATDIYMGKITLEEYLGKSN